MFWGYHHLRKHPGVFCQRKNSRIPKISCEILWGLMWKSLRGWKENSIPTMSLEMPSLMLWFGVKDSTWTRNANGPQDSGKNINRMLKRLFISWSIGGEEKGFKPFKPQSHNSVVTQKNGVPVAVRERAEKNNCTWELLQPIGLTRRGGFQSASLVGDSVDP